MLLFKSITITSVKIKDNRGYSFLTRIRREKKKSPHSPPHPKSCSSVHVCLSLQRGQRANSMWKFSPAGACAAGGGSVAAPTAHLHDSLSEEKEQSVPHFKKTQSWQDKGRKSPSFFFFFLKARNFFNFHIVRRIKRSPACLMLLWGKIGADGLWGGMFIESDPQFRDSKAFLLAHASGRDFLSQKFRRVARRPVKDCFIMRRTGRKSRWFI